MVVQKTLLLKFKPLVDWLKVAVVQDKGTYILGVYYDPVLLAVDNALMDHLMTLQKIFQVAGHPYHLCKPSPLDVMHLLLKSWELRGELKEKQWQR